MAIADGMAINCSDLQAVGGTRFIAIRKWIDTDTVSFDDTELLLMIVQFLGLYLDLLQHNLKPFTLLKVEIA